MNFEKKMKQRIDQNLNNMVKNPYEVKKVEKAHKLPFWAKLAIPASGVVLATSIALAVLLPLANAKTKDAVGNRLTTAKVTKIVDQTTRTLSTKTYNSYTAFAKKFTKLVLETNNSEKEASLGISIPDAYLCLAITGVISSEAALNDVLAYLELSSIEELRTAVTEIVAVLCTLTEDKEGRLNGGYNLNSIWLDPEQVELLATKDEQLYKDLEEVFDATTYLEALTSEKANKYLKENGIKNMPTPEVKLDDSNPSAVSVMSAFWCLDFFAAEAKQSFENQYKSGNHKMDYTFGDTKKKVDYIETQCEAPVYEGDDFYGTTSGINNLLVSFFLPNDEKALPSTIMDDVLNENYRSLYTSYEGPDGSQVDKAQYQVHLSAPYFSLDNFISLEHQDLAPILPNITASGAASRLAKTKTGFDMYLDNIAQFSVMKFNYDGFYSCSVTISQMRPTSARWPSPNVFELTLDHPYIFNVSKTVFKDGTDWAQMPIVIGEIVDPNYID